MARHVLDTFPEMRFSVSATTRPRRPGEVDGVHYYFLTHEDFHDRVARGAFLEYEEVYPGLFYGTLHSEVDRLLAHHPVLFDVEVDGALNIKRHFGDRALTVFIRPPSLDVLAERLRARKTETPATIAARLRRAERELAAADRFDAVVLNDDLPTAVRETLSLVESFLSVPEDQSNGPSDPVEPAPDATS